MAKILIVEDDKNLSAIYGDRLLAEGHEIVTSHDGEEALAVAVKENPDLIISDVMMPKISGFDMLDILRSTPETQNTKVIMMTALSQAEDKERASTLGADKYLVKSQVTLDDVARVVQEVLASDTTPAAPTPVDTPVAPTAAPAMAAAMPTSQPAQTPVAAAPAAVPMTPAPVSESVAAPAPEPVVAAEPAQVSIPPAEPVMADAPAVDPAPAAAAAAQDAESAASEQAEVSSQIDAFVSSNLPDTPTPAPVSESVAAPAPEPVVAAEPAQVSIPPAEPVMADAPAVDPAPAAPSSGQKVIEPLQEQMDKPDIHALYEKEMAAEAAQAAVPTPEVGSVVEAAPAAPAPEASQDAPKPGDPGAIAL